MVPWDDLDEDFKEANRAQAAHIGVKLAAMGCDLLPLTDWAAESFTLREEEVDRLAEMEHERWVEERRRAGWTLGPRDDVRRRTPNLVGWSELSEDMREYDRVFVRGLPRFLASAGFQIGRRGDRARARSVSAVPEDVA